jgi:hypothetical protein
VSISRLVKELGLPSNDCAAGQIPKYEHLWQVAQALFWQAGLAPRVGKG